MIEIGLKHISELVVTDDVTAVRVGSGDSGETLLGEGTHLRFVVEREKFMSRL